MIDPVVWQHPGRHNALLSLRRYYRQRSVLVRYFMIYVLVFIVFTAVVFYGTFVSFRHFQFRRSMQELLSNCTDRNTKSMLLLLNDQTEHLALYSALLTIAIVTVVGVQADSIAKLATEAHDLTELWKAVQELLKRPG